MLMDPFAAGIPEVMRVSGKFRVSNMSSTSDFWQLNNRLKLLQPHAQRLRSIVFPDCIPKAWLPRLLPLFDGEIPALERLEFWWKIQDPPEGLNLRLSHHRHPHLHDLKLSRSGVSLPVDFPFLHGLRKLVLHSCSTPLTYDQFLGALSGSSQLMELHLTKFLNSLGRAADVTLARSPVDMSQLTTLSVIAHSPRVTSTFLSHLRLSAFVQVDLEGLLGNATEDDVVETLSDLLPPYETLRELVLPILAPSSAVTSVTVKVESNTYEMITPPNQTGSLSLAVYSQMAGLWEDSLDRGVGDLFNVFFDAPLTHLSLEGNQNGLDATIWGLVLTTFPTLEVLEVSGDGTLTAVWEALSAGLGDGNAGADAVLCLRLRRFESSGYTTDSHDLLRLVLGCLEKRAARGSRLKELVLCFMEHYARMDQNPELEEMRGMYWRQLMVFVEDVVYDYV
ncbi:hypothetical protein C8Q78DRAFT_1155859 [Trametes maxima]|nr:hypothetical protein C8Q78DRAFT_1155859 [Trametes maxima]